MMLLRSHSMWIGFTESFGNKFNQLFIAKYVWTRDNSGIFLRTTISTENTSQYTRPTCSDTIFNCTAARHSVFNYLSFNFTIVSSSLFLFPARLNLTFFVINKFLSYKKKKLRKSINKFNMWRVSFWIMDKSAWLHLLEPIILTMIISLFSIYIHVLFFICSLFFSLNIYHVYGWLI